jgi:hypothetical protein
MLPFSLVLSLIALFASPVAAQQSSACSLLAPGDIEVATGAKAGATHPSDYEIPVGPNKSLTVPSCTWTVPTHQGQVVISLGPGAASDEDTVKMAKNNPGTDALRAAHYKEEAKDFPNAWCSIMTPPPSTKDGVMMSTCSAGVKGKVLSIVFMSPSKTLTIDQAKALLDKAGGRLH